jgi:hypothetical protein
MEISIEESPQTLRLSKSLLSLVTRGRIMTGRVMSRAKFGEASHAGGDGRGNDILVHTKGREKLSS